MREAYEGIEIGDTVELVYCNDPYTKLQPGLRGIFKGSTMALGSPQLAVEWENGSRLMMIPDDGDQIRKVSSIEP